MSRQWISFLNFPDQFPLSTDSVLLADFAAGSAARSVLDLCAGCCTIGLMMAAKNAACRVEGLELQAHAVSRAQELILHNGLEHRVHVTQGDVRQIQEYFRASSLDAVVANPPYFPAGHGAASASEALAIARTELCCTLDDVCKAAAYVLRWGAPFYLVHKPERLCDVICALRKHRLEPKRLQFVRHRASAPPALILIESRMGGNASLTVQNDLILHHEDGSETKEYRRIYGLEE